MSLILFILFLGLSVIIVASMAHFTAVALFLIFFGCAFSWGIFKTLWKNNFKLRG